MPRHRCRLLGVVLLAGMLAACSADGQSGAGRSAALGREVAEAVVAPDPTRLPILFVHGNLGSGDLFETPAQRFTSNGYPVDHVDALDYDASSSDSRPETVFPLLDAKITAVLTATRASRIDLVGQAEGAQLIESYLGSSPARLARVAHVVSVEGPLSYAPPAGLSMLAVWGDGDPTHRIAGAVNARFVNQDRTQLLTSAGTFREMYQFLTGSRPVTTDVTAGPGQIEISGRALLYPANVGVSAGRVEVHQLDPRTGERGANSLKGFFTLSADGSWGPFRGDGSSGYEFAIVRPGQPVHHFYYPPFHRSDHLVRLLTSDPGREIGGGMETGPTHTNLIIDRALEWWGDRPGANDVLTIDGTNVVSAAAAPRAKQTLRIFLFDRGSDGRTDLTVPIPNYFGIGFMTGVDLFIPSGGRSIEVAMTPRGQAAHREVLHVPAWPSVSDRVTLHFDADS